jgi:hypothetical protein
MSATTADRVHGRTPPPELVYSSGPCQPVDLAGLPRGRSRARLLVQPLHWARQTLGYLERRAARFLSLQIHRYNRAACRSACLPAHITRPYGVGQSFQQCHGYVLP